MSEPAGGAESLRERSARFCRPRVSILEMMVLVAAVAVSLRWPGLSVPMGLVLLYAFAQRRDILSRRTRDALGQVALALYLPPALGFVLFPLAEWGHYLEHLSRLWTFFPWALVLFFLGWWYTAYSLLFTVATICLVAISTLGAIWGLGFLARRAINWRSVFLRLAAVMLGLVATFIAFRLAPKDYDLLNSPLAQVVVSTAFAVCVIPALAMVARCGIGWRIACLVLTAVMSAGSTFFNWIVLHLPT
jgi:hypothetical protein